MEGRLTMVKEKKSGVDTAPALNIRNSALASPGNDIPPALGSGVNLSDIPTKAQIQHSQKPDKSKSHGSLRSDDDDGVGRGREINDTLMGRLIYLQWSIFAIIIEILLIYFFVALHSDEGLTINVGGQVFQQTVPIILVLWMHLCYICTNFALSKGLAAYFAHQISQKSGYSLIVCGFIQSGFFEKVQFASLLNVRSKYKKVVSRASALWFMHFCGLILTFFSSTAISIGESRYDSGTLLCINYGQVGLPVDRGSPTLNMEIGAAEFAPGSSLGLLRSEDDSLEETTLITHPQLIDKASDGTIISGSGFVTTFKTKCQVSKTQLAADLIYAGIPSKNATAMQVAIKNIGKGGGIAHMLEYNATTPSIKIYSCVNGYRLGGGANYVNKTKTICITTIESHDATDGVKVSWTNDGNGVRSSPNEVSLDPEAELTPANMTWLYQALKNVIGGDISFAKTPGFYPGTITPLMRWTSHNLQAPSVALLQGGMETYYALVAKAGITRTYSVAGAHCTQNLLDSSRTTLTISKNGYQIGLIFAIFELSLAILSVLGCVPWFIYKDPIIPAIRLVTDRTYFNIMLCKNSTGNLLRMIGSTADRTDIWPKLDMEVRVGENIQTVSNMEFGEIILDKPKLVTQLSWLKSY